MHMLFPLICSFVQHEVVSSALSFDCAPGFIVVGGFKFRGTSSIIQCRGRCDECDLGRRIGEPERRRQPAIEDVRHTVDRAIIRPQTGVREAQRDHLLFSVSWLPPLGSTPGRELAKVSRPLAFSKESHVNPVSVAPFRNDE